MPPVRPLRNEIMEMLMGKNSSCYVNIVQLLSIMTHFGGPFGDFGRFSAAKRRIPVAREGELLFDARRKLEIK